MADQLLLPLAEPAKSCVVGARFGRLTVLGEAPGRYRVYVRCDCGKERDIYRYNLLDGVTRSCGCIRFKLPCDAGMRFGRLTVLGEAPKAPNSMRRVWVKCDCGTVKSVQPDKLISRETVSCGCHSKARSTTHGMSYNNRHPLYAAWQNMHTRCTNPNHEQFKDWGGRGIKVCERWQSFENFRDDMGPSWQAGLLLDRRNNDGDYEPGNCRWVTWVVQNSNRRSTIFIQTPWGRLCLKHAAQRFGVPYNKFRQQYHQG